MPQGVEPESLARVWFKEHAFFRVPVYDPLSKSRSSSEVQGVHVRALTCKLPTLAFCDKDKAARFIDGLDEALGDSPLLPGSISEDDVTNDKDVEKIYEKLFSPEVEKKDKVPYDEWLRMCNEVDCNRLTSMGMMYAVKSATSRMFEMEITTKSEALNPGRRSPALSLRGERDSKERVDMVVEDKDGNALFLIEGKNPNVVEALASLLDSGEVLKIDLYSNLTNDRRVLNKVIYYMCFRNVHRLVVTSFSTAYILEMHDTRKGTFISYSTKIDQHEDSTLFRALLGLTLVQLKIATIEEFPVVDAYSEYRTELARTLAAARTGRGGRGGGRGGGAGGSGSGLGSGSSKKGGSSTGKKDKDTDRKDPSGRSGEIASSARKGGTKRPLEVTSVEDTATDSAGRVISPITATISSKPTISLERQETVPEGKGSVIRFMDSEEFTHGTGLSQVEFVRNARAPFPVLPTLDRVPCLTVLDEMSVGSAVTVYITELQAPLDSKASHFVVKVVNAAFRSHEEYRNPFKELLNEYQTYYMLGQCKRDNRFGDIIESTTPTCYGLYKARRKLQDVFALVMEDAGSMSPLRWRLWPSSEKQAMLHSIISLHSVGLIHGDAAERNIAFKYNERDEVETSKFFDFDNSSWHDCPGILECEELRGVWRSVSPLDPPLPPMDFQERVMRLYGLPFYNIKRRYGKMNQMDREVIVKRLGHLSKVYDDEAM